MMFLRLGAPIQCEGKEAGTVADVVIEPTSRRLTHVVVEAEEKIVRLVPAEHIDESKDGAKELTLTCSIAELNACEPIRELAYMRVDEFPQPDGDTDIGVEDMVAMPSYGAGSFGDYVGDFDSSVSLTYDRIPKGKAELRRASDVVSADGELLGHLDGFVVLDGRVTHVVLERGHLWGARDVSIPIEMIDSIKTDGVTTTLTKDEVGALPSVRVHKFPFG
jgi:sporulation protein YlmC with PRC-barrel domain